MRRKFSSLAVLSRFTSSAWRAFTSRKAQMVITSCLAGVLCLLSAAATAQDITGSIAGTVKDPSGALIGGAKVTVANADTGVVARTIQTDETGSYSAPVLPIGRYNITVEKGGFRKASITGVQLNVHDKLVEDVVLQVGATQEEVTVQASAVQVELENPQAAGLIDGTQIREIPLNNRNYEQLVALQPGVSYGSGDQLFVGTTNPSGETNVVSFSINGQRNSANNWTVDGADNVDRGSNLTLLAYPSVDAIAEFTTLRGNYSAESGRSASGMIDVVTRSGTSRFHGDLYEFFRNDALNANDYISNSNGLKMLPLRYNDFGFSVGGPVAIPKVYKGTGKTFFFYSQEFYRIITSRNLLSTVPTGNERQGIFPNTVCTARSGTGACTATGTSITNIDPVAQAYLKDVIDKLPLPNPAAGASPNSLLAPFRSTFDHTQELVKIDHTFGPRLSAFFRFINDDIPTFEPGGLFTGAVLPGVASTKTNSPGRGYLGHFTSPLTSTWLLDGGYAYSSGAIVSDPVGTIAKANSPDIAPTLPFTSTLPRIPKVTLRGGSSIAGFGPYRDYDRDHNLFANVSKMLGTHSLRAGISYNHYQKTENAAGNNAGTFAFRRPLSGDPVLTGTTYEQAFANFLTGAAFSFTQDSRDLTPDINTNQYELYVQDEWRVRHNLTLSYGVRYSFFQQPYDANNLLTNFDPQVYDPAKAPTIDANGKICTVAPCVGGGTPNPNFDPLNGIIVNGQNSPFGNRVSDANHNFAPRLGFAWDPFGKGRTSIRGGYGVAYDSSLFGTYEQNIFQNPPFVQSVSISKTQFGNPGVVAPNINAFPPALHGTPVHFHTPYNQQWSLDVQHELVHNFVVDVGYYGSKGTHLLGIADINQPLPNNGSQNINQIRPFKGYDAINALDTRYDSNYHSLQASSRWKLSGNSLLVLAYTWSHGLTDAQTDRSSTPQNTYDVRAEYGPSQLDRRHVFSANYVYDLPFFSKRHDVLGYTLGNWEVSGLVTANTGLPFTPFDNAGSADPLNQGLQDGASFASLRPNQVANPNTGAPHTFNQWFNTAAFVSVPGTQTFDGTAGRGAIRGPGYSRWDVGLMKNIPVNENMRFQFRAEAFNVFNHTNFLGIDPSIGDANYGKVTSVRDPRIMQLALKFYF